MNLRILFSISLVIPIFSVIAESDTNSKKLQVYIMAGQSNMEGHAKIETFDYMADDPKTVPLLKKMRQENGQPAVADRVWISYLTGRGDNNGEGFGKLTAGYGSRSNPKEDGGKIGPEFTMGLTLDEVTEAPILIIKTAWGGKSLFYDFRSPENGVYQRSEQDIEKNRLSEESCGHYYRLMIDHVKMVLKDVSRVVEGYDNSLGYELKGFVWFQGWNDMVNRNVYPNGDYKQYTNCLNGLITSVRKEFSVPDLPVVVGVMGVGGKTNPKQEAFRYAMRESQRQLRHVFAVETSEFWDEQLAAIADKRGQVKQMGYYLRKENKNYANKDGSMTKEQQSAYLKKFEADLISEKEQHKWQRGASNAGYHYLGCAKTFALMGQAYAHVLMHAE